MNKTQPDPAMKDYWRNSRRFADLINGCLFEGKEVIHADDLVPYDTDESAVVLTRGEKNVTIQRNRDILKMHIPEAGFALIGVENQQKVHNFMPLRIAVYDILDYVNQQRQWEESIRRKRKQKSRKTQKQEKVQRQNETLQNEEQRHEKEPRLKLIPVYSLVVYYGESEWNQAQSLWDLMDIPEYMERCINNWNCRIVQVRSYDRELFKDPEVYSFFEACQQLYQVQGDLSALEGIHLTRETAIAVGTVTGTRELIEMAESEGDEIDMCMALDNLIKEKVSAGKREGKIEGKLEGKREGTLETCISFFEQGMISLSAAAQKCELTEEEFLREIEMRKAGAGSDGGVQS